MRHAIPVVLALSVLVGCETASPPAPSPGPATRPATAPATGPTAAAAAPTADQIFARLAATTWTSRPPDAKTWPPSDHGVATYAADGSWSAQLFSDYTTQPETGKWNLQRDPAGAWLLCTDDGRRGRITLNADGTINLGVGRLYPDKPAPRDARHTAATLPELTFGPGLRARIDRVTAGGWKRTNDLDLGYEPTHVRLNRDWTYVATYRNGECTSRGGWYATKEEVVATSTDGHCDVRPGEGGDQFRIDLTDDGHVLVGGDLYVPEEQPVKRGLIWALFGFSDVAPIRVEYDMPVRKGVPVRFDVTITSRGDSPLTLHRFALTDHYDNYGRDAGRGKAPVVPKEIVGKDLGAITLKKGESHAFAVDATFPEAGQHSVYFNALITGTTQNWDTHVAHQFTVHAAP